MKKNKTKLTLLILLVAVLSISSVVGAWAYFTHLSNVQNRLITKGSEVILRELFNPADHWVPGEEKIKEVMFGNRGELDQVLRFKVTPTWYDNNGTPNILSDDTAWNFTGTYDPVPAVINWTGGGTGPTASDWDVIDGWYYYKKVLPMGTGASPSMTPQVIDSVTFSPAISNSGPGAADDFSNKRYSLLIEMQTVDVSTLITAEAWDVIYSQSGTSLSWTTAPGS